MLSEKNRASLKSYENRLENEHNDPEFIPQEECRHCDELTEQDTNDPGLCGDCLLPYDHTDTEAIEHLQNHVDALKGEVGNLVKLVKILHLPNARTATEIGEIRDALTAQNLHGTWLKAFEGVYRYALAPDKNLCAVCGEKPSLQKSLACEHCVEGGEPISEMLHLSSSSYCLACNKEHPHRGKICVQCAGEGWYLDDSQRVCLEGGEK
jgi:hypothetical protein